MIDTGVRRKPRKAGEVLTIPEPDSESWEPFVLDTPCRVASLSDIHVPYHDKAALQVAVKEAKKRKSDVILLNGDGIDFYGISRFEKNPEKRDAISEIAMLVDLLRYLDQEFPHARKVYKLGNHCERYDKWLWANAPVLYKLEALRFAGVLGLVYGEKTGKKTYDIREHGWEIVQDKRPILAGHLPILHGHEINASSPVNPARGAYLKTSHTVLIGHLHRTAQHTHPNMFHEETSTWSQGALCGLRPNYAPINFWNHGAAYIDVAANRDFDMDNIRIQGGSKARKS